MSLSDIKSNRMKLLKLEAEYDEKISKCPCKEQVVDHLLLLRATNRNQTGELCQAGFLNYKAEYAKHLAFFVRIYEGDLPGTGLCNKICSEKI